MQLPGYLLTQKEGFEDRVEYRSDVLKNVSADRNGSERLSMDTQVKTISCSDVARRFSS